MPPFSITVSGESLNELSDNLARVAKRLVAGEAATVAADAAPAPAAKPDKPARTRAAPAAAPAAPAAPAAAPAAPAADPAVTKKNAIAGLVKLINAHDALVPGSGKQVCTDLCLKFGGTNVSKIAPEKHQALIDEVAKALEALNDNPAA